jgi:hypothetical protein
VLQQQFKLTVVSLFKHASLPLNIHIIGEDASQKLAEELLSNHVPQTAKYKVSWSQTRVITYDILCNVTECDFFLCTGRTLGCGCNCKAA